MLELDSHPSGRHFLQIPGPTNVPDRVLRAIDNPTIDHRGPEFGRLGKAVLAGIKRVFQTEQDVIIYPASGTGAWEAALVNTLSPGDRVLMAETGQFATLWKKLAERLGLVVDFMPGDWRQGANAARNRETAARRQRPRDQGRLRRAQRDVDRRDHADPADPRRDRPRRPPRPAASSTRSRRSARSTTATTNGASTSRSAARRRA